MSTTQNQHDPEKIYAPFTAVQVAALNEYQKLGFVHEYTQNWAFRITADPEYLELLKDEFKFFKNRLNSTS